MINSPSETGRKINIICSRGSLEDIYTALILANGAVMEGIETNIFFTFFGIDALVKKRMGKIQASAAGNSALRITKNLRFPALATVIPGAQSIVTGFMKKKMAGLDIPPVEEMLEMITAGGGKIYACKLALEMFDLDPSELSEHVAEILTVGDFYTKSEGERSQIIAV